MPKPQSSEWILYNTSGQPLELYLDDDGLLIVDAYGQAKVGEAAANSPQAQALARRNVIHLEPAPPASPAPPPEPEQAPPRKARHNVIHPEAAPPSLPEPKRAPPRKARRARKPTASHRSKDE